MPWSVGASPILQFLNERFRTDTAVLALIDLDEPGSGVVLAARGTEPATLKRWREQGYRGDVLLRAARQHGVAVGRTAANQPGPPLPSGLEVACMVLPVSLTGTRAWYLALGRPEGTFSEEEQANATRLLRVLSADFDHVAPPRLGRVLLDQDHNIIQSDPVTESWLAEHPAAVQVLREQLPVVVEQRWPELTDNVGHDLALDLAGQARWIRVRRLRAQADELSPYWALEFRPLGKDDIPAMGEIEDSRVARAVGHLSDHYAKAPTLADVAEVAHTSPFHFHRLFVREVGISPKRYLLKMQLMLAKWKLAATGTSIGQVAVETGFASHGHFTATFHRLVGQSPSHYREAH